MHENTVITVLIVDDEKKACTNLEHMLKEYAGAGLCIVGMAHNTIDAEKQINQLKPDAVFLDIEMPNENAFHFLDRIGPLSFEIVFITSYNEYAIKAFRLNAVDYILKPISINELVSAVEKLKEKVRYKKTIASTNSSYANIADDINDKVMQQRIVLKSLHTTEVVDFRNIYFIEAQGSYSRIVFLKGTVVKEIVMSNPLSDYEELLPSTSFCRIHRSFLINAAVVKDILNEQPHKVILSGGYTLPVSRRRYSTLLDFLKQQAG